MANFLQNTLENLASALGLSTAPATWRERLREEIQLTAPDGTIFTAHWRGNTRTIPNKIGIHTFFGVAGAKIQKGGTGPEIYDLSIIFGGADNDLNAAAFMNVYKETSTLDKDWTIEHPTDGPIFGVFVTTTQHNFPVTSGNLTIINCPFIINLPDTAEESAAQAQARANTQASILNGTASDQFVDVSILDTSGAQAIITGVAKGVSTVREVLSIVSNTDIIPAEIESIITGINNTLSQDTIDTLLLSNQVQQLVQIFGRGQNLALNAINMFGDFIDQMIGIAPTQATSEGRSTIATTELYVTAALSAAAEGALIGGITSRQEALTAIDKLTSIMNTVTDGLDTTQQLYNEQPINNRYFSQSSSYADAITLISDAQRFLLISLFGLPAERRIILDQNKGTWQIAFDEYGSMGDPPGDPLRYFANVEKLIASNHWHGDGMYWRHAGDEVLIYQS